MTDDILNDGASRAILRSVMVKASSFADVKRQFRQVVRDNPEAFPNAVLVSEPIRFREEDK